MLFAVLSKFYLQHHRTGAVNLKKVIKVLYLNQESRQCFLYFGIPYVYFTYSYLGPILLSVILELHKNAICCSEQILFATSQNRSCKLKEGNKSFVREPRESTVFLVFRHSCVLCTFHVFVDYGVCYMSSSVLTIACLLVGSVVVLFTP